MYDRKCILLKPSSLFNKHDLRLRASKQFHVDIFLAYQTNFVKTKRCRSHAIAARKAIEGLSCRNEDFDLYNLVHC